MYYIYIDGKLYYTSSSTSTGLYSAKVETKENSTQSLTYSVAPESDLYSAHKMLKSVIEIYQDKPLVYDNLIFRGRPIKEDVDFYGNKTVTCEGALGYLYDSIQRPKSYTGKSIKDILKSLLDIHNNQVEDYKKIYPGTITVIDKTDSKIYSGKYQDDNDIKIANDPYDQDKTGTSTKLQTDYDTTFDAINNLLISNLAGYIDIRYDSDGKQYLDYLKDYRDSEGQIILFGTNLLDYSSTLDYGSICTGVLPLGSSSSNRTAVPDANLTYEQSTDTTDTIDNKLTVKTVNGNNDIVWADQTVIDALGKVVKKVEWSDVDDPSKLLEKAKNYLTNKQYENLTLNCKLIDLHYIDDTYKPLHFLHKVRIISKPHGLDKELPITDMSIDILDPSQNTVTLGHALNSLTGQMTQNENGLNGVKGSIANVENTLTNNKDIASTNIRKTNYDITLEANRRKADGERLQASINVNASAISSEVSRATSAENSVRSYVKQTADSFRLGFNGTDTVSIMYTNENGVQTTVGTVNLSDLHVKANNVDFTVDGFTVDASKINFSGTTFSIDADHIIYNGKEINLGETGKIVTKSADSSTEYYISRGTLYIKSVNCEDLYGDSLTVGGVNVTYSSGSTADDRTLNIDRCLAVNGKKFDISSVDRVLLPAVNHMKTNSGTYLATRQWVYDNFQPKDGKTPNPIPDRAI